MKQIAEDVPKQWKTNHDLRCHIAFLTDFVAPDEVMQQTEVREGIDFVEEGNHVMYMTTKMSGLTKSKFTKLIGKKIFREITIRNYNTSQKILSLMEQE